MARPCQPGPIAVLTIAALLAACAGEPPEPVAATSPSGDVVLIVIDTLRPDHLGSYGYSRETAPFLGALAGESALFERAFSTSSWTAPATASLFTALYPPQHGVIEGFFAHRGRVEQIEQDGSAVLELNRMPAGMATLPERFRERGYRTYGLSANINIGEEMGFARGFDRFERIHGPGWEDSPPAEVIEARLEQWASEIGSGGPNFVYLHFNDPHAPYVRNAPYYQEAADPLQQAVAAYDSEIGYLDETLRRIYLRFGWEDALLVIVSDHGEEFMEHGRMGHRFSLYRELSQILLMIRSPRAPRPYRLTDTVSIVDVLPTLAELAGLRIDSGWHGRSLAPRLTDPGGASERRTVFAHRAHLGQPPLQLWSAIRGRHQLLQLDGRRELYDWIADPAEQHELLVARPQVAEELTRELIEFRERLSDAVVERIEVQIDADGLERLRALGYVD